MTPTSVALGSPHWLAPAVALMVVGVGLVAWSYFRWRRPRWVALSSAGLKFVGIAALALCLVEPLLTGSRPSPGANLFVVLVDTSQSLTVRDGDSDRSRADWSKKLLEGNPAWRARLGQDFALRGGHLRARFERRGGSRLGRGAFASEGQEGEGCDRHEAHAPKMTLPPRRRGGLIR